MDTGITSNKTLLFIDDEEYVRDGLKTYFTKHGFNVLTAGGGNEGWTLLTANSVDLIVSDVRMANGTGPELLTRIKNERNSHPPMILMTGYSEQSPKELLDMGAHIVVSKPFSKKDLLEIIKSTLSISSNPSA